ncbi:MAG: metal-dependent hydrolase [Planctomycetaceae bacterium]|nr:metal-dependent hydrolase [Planctomycetaceae bacterium]
MRVIFLGTGGYHPNARRHTSCVLLPDIGLVFDAGTSFFRVQALLKTDEIDVYLSHAHLDHVCGLTYFLVPLALGQVNAMRVHANRPTLDTVEQHVFAERLFPVAIPFAMQELTESRPVGQGGTLRFQALPSHPGGSTAFRLDWPADSEGGRGRARSLAYVTDTTVDETYREFIRGADVLIHECNFPDSQAHWCEKTGHSCTSPVARLAREAGVGRLILTHIDPQLDGDDPVDIATARAIFPNTVVAEDLMEFEL